MQLAANRLSIDESGLDPTVVYRKVSDTGEEIRTFSPLEFLAELSLHIPKVFEQTTRMFGIYSSSSRGKVAREEKYQAWVQNNFEPLDPEPEERPASASFARCMKNVFEIDPLKCKRCGSQMKIIAFIFNSHEIQKIADNLKLPTWRSPPPFIHTGIRYDASPDYA